MSLFRIVAFLEGFSWITLLFFAVPMKYIWNVELYVQKIGMAHGVLFIVYIVLAFFLQLKINWSRNHMLIILIGSIVPFGFLYVDKKCLKNKT
tara:strand:- start:1169 stop:1447 length:279 start_codon:yes stop_codon:yes gene_type:complete